MSKKRLEIIIDKVKAYKIPVPEIAKQTGLNERWLYAIKSGQIGAPGYDKLDILENYLQAHEEIVRSLASENCSRVVSLNTGVKSCGN